MFLLLILVLSSLTYLHSDNINHNISIKAKNGVSQKLGLYEKKADLYQRMEEFNEQSFYFLNLDDNTILQFDDDDGEVEEGEEIDNDDDNNASVTEEAEDYAQDQAFNLLLPSKIANKNTHTVSEEVKSMEIDLRKGQANDALEGLRESLGFKSMLMVTKVSYPVILCYYLLKFD